jgi:hypothetical protein
MKHPIYISFFGLGLSVIRELKTIISQQFSIDHDIHWTNIADKKLQVLLINDDYVDVNHLKTLDLSKLAVLKLYKDDSRAGQILNDILYLPLKAPDQLIIWLNKKLDSVAPNIPAASQIERPAPEPAAVIKIQPTISPAAIQKAFDKMHLSYTNSTKFVIKNKDVNVAILDTEQKEFFLNPKVEIEHWDGFEIRPADINQIVSFKHRFKAIDLNTGIWQFVWNYLADDSLNFPLAYQLLHWPQPAASQNRSEVLKMAAYFSHGCTVRYIQDKTQFSKQRIERFIFSCEVSQMIETITAPRTASSTEAAAANQAENSVKHSFFSKLRLKLGL